ncbi:hypothetical protein BC834DRAFT_158619 [Gloeopeniophorella convolvens]|nr:hypothetical protein BC834DRAFT_158619 [Gloeopeniophorella convolvens]
MHPARGPNRPTLPTAPDASALPHVSSHQHSCQHLPAGHPRAVLPPPNPDPTRPSRARHLCKRQPLNQHCARPDPGSEHGKRATAQHEQRPRAGPAHLRPEEYALRRRVPVDGEREPWGCGWRQRCSDVRAEGDDEAGEERREEGRRGKRAEECCLRGRCGRAPRAVRIRLWVCSRGECLEQGRIGGDTLRHHCHRRQV